MLETGLSRRRMIQAGSAAAAASMFSLGSPVAAQGAKIAIPPPIGRSERMARLARARALMQRHSIGAIVIEPGASLDYFTGVQWWRSSG